MTNKLNNLRALIQDSHDNLNRAISHIKESEKSNTKLWEILNEIEVEGE
jgi:hypothetical protein